jgi:outer membrane protein TolC
MMRIASLLFVGMSTIAPLATAQCDGPRDVEDALGALARARATAERLHETFNAARGKYFVALRKYAAGLSDLQTAFDAERELLAAETDLDAARSEEASAFAALSRRVLAPYCSDDAKPKAQKRWAI